VPWASLVEKRPDAKSNVDWLIAMGPGKRKALEKENAADALIDQAEKIKLAFGPKWSNRFV
jgi:IS5 family transposase